MLKNIYLHELVFRNIQYFINFENKLKYMCVWKFEKIKAWKTKSHVLLQALSDSSNYHEFYRLLARLKTNYQLGELVKVTNYPELIKRIAEFTVTSLRVRIFKWIKKEWMHIFAMVDYTSVLL